MQQGGSPQHLSSCWQGFVLAQVTAAKFTQGDICRPGFYDCVSATHTLLPAGRLTQLSWSSNSELLAVVLTTDAQQEQAASARVQIWHRSNWHWYLKQEQVYSGAQTLNVCWDQVAPLRLHIVSSSAWYRQVSAQPS